MPKYRLKVGIVEAVTLKRYVEIEADNLAEAENLAVTLECDKIVHEEAVNH